MTQWRSLFFFNGVTKREKLLPHNFKSTTKIENAIKNCVVPYILFFCSIFTNWNKLKRKECRNVFYKNLMDWNDPPSGGF